MNTESPGPRNRQVLFHSVIVPSNKQTFIPEKKNTLERGLRSETKLKGID